MENRLFLLKDEPGQNFDKLKNAILADVDVTKPEAYTGKITLSQLNAYSGELTAEALTNFKTIKIEKNGGAYETNLAKLLLELQQGGGVEDAIEEAIIEIDSKKGDAELRDQIQELTGYVSSLHHTPESYAAELDDVVSSVEEHKLSAWAPSVEEADGTRTQFKSKEMIAKAEEEQFLVVLNGVIVTPEDGNVIYSNFGPYAIGFEFSVAPSVGDIVEFHGTRVAGKSSGPYIETIEKNTSTLDQNSNSMDDFTVVTDAKKVEIQSEKEKVNAEIEELQLRMKEDEKSRTEAYEALVSASSIDDVKKHSEEVKSLDEELSSLRQDLNSLNHFFKRLDADEKSLIEDIAASNVIFGKIKKEGSTLEREFTEIVDMFKAIANELNGGSAEPKA